MTDKSEAQRLADAPERIWLQVCDDAGCVESFAEHDGVTWCQHRINDTDIEYVRAERIAALEQALEQAREAMEEMQYARTDKAERLTAEALRKIKEVRKC